MTGRTDTGRVRARNEDSLSLDPDRSIAVVTDGMGGHPGGNVASRVAAIAAARSLAALRKDGPGSLARAMSRSVLVAHEAVRAKGRADPALSGMGTTLIAWIGDPDTGAWCVGHVGDSRGYRLRGEMLQRLTRDDTWVQDRLDRHQLSPEEARSHPLGHMLTQCLGLEEPPVTHVVEGHVEEGDRFLLCTDGLMAMMDDEDIRRCLVEHASDYTAVQALVDEANRRGGKDNTTVVVVSVGDPATSSGPLLPSPASPRSPAG